LDRRVSPPSVLDRRVLGRRYRRPHFGLIALRSKTSALLVVHDVLGVDDALPRAAVLPFPFVARRGRLRCGAGIRAGLAALLLSRALIQALRKPVTGGLEPAQRRIDGRLVLSLRRLLDLLAPFANGGGLGG